MKKSVLAVLLLALAGATAFAAIDFEFAGARTYTVFGFLPVPTGADARLIFSDDAEDGFPGRIILAAGGGYELKRVYRLGDGTRLSGGYELSDVELDRLELYLEPMVSLTPIDNRPLTVDAGFRSHFRRNYSYDDALIATGGYFSSRDLGGALVNTVRAGARYRDIIPGIHGEITGFDASSMVEVGPRFLGNSIDGGADFIRINATARGYLPLFDVDPGRELNLFQLSVAGQVTADLLTGRMVPLHEQQYSRGYVTYRGLGKLVRGFEDSSYPSLVKISANAEFRAIGPAIVWGWLAPVLVLFADAGYYSGFTEAGYFSGSDDGDNGFIASVGATLTIHLLGAMHLGFTLAAPIAGERADQSSIGTALAIGLHF